LPLIAWVIDAIAGCLTCGSGTEYTIDPKPRQLYSLFDGRCFRAPAYTATANGGSRP